MNVKELIKVLSTFQGDLTAVCYDELDPSDLMVVDAVYVIENSKGVRAVYLETGIEMFNDLKP